jgi:hypothetical protein
MRRELDPNNLLRASAGVSQHASGPLLTSNHRLAALPLTGAIEAAEDDEESERSNAAADRVSPESVKGARTALRCH